MFQPARTKYRKAHKGRIHGKAKGGTDLNFGNFGLKATERVTVVRYPALKRYGKEAGKANPDFLNADVFRAQFLEPLAPFRERLAPVILEFSQFRPGQIAMAGTRLPPPTSLSANSCSARNASSAG